MKVIAAFGFYVDHIFMGWFVREGVLFGTALTSTVVLFALACGLCGLRFWFNLVDGCGLLAVNLFLMLIDAVYVYVFGHILFYYDFILLEGFVVWLGCVFLIVLVIGGDVTIVVLFAYTYGLCLMCFLTVCRAFVDSGFLMITAWLNVVKFDGCKVVWLFISTLRQDVCVRLVVGVASGNGHRWVWVCSTKLSLQRGLRGFYCCVIVRLVRFMIVWGFIFGVYVLHILYVWRRMLVGMPEELLALRLRFAVVDGVLINVFTPAVTRCFKAFAVCRKAYIGSDVCVVVTFVWIELIYAANEFTIIAYCCWCVYLLVGFLVYRSDCLVISWFSVLIAFLLFGVGACEIHICTLAHACFQNVEIGVELV
eukprot:gene3181-2163_t